MKRTGLAAMAVVLALAGCSVGHSRNDASDARNRFVNSADQICAQHLEATLALLGREEHGSEWRRQATRNEGIYEILATSIQRLEALGTAPDPQGDAFRSYVKTLKARASLYRIAGVADLHRDAVMAARMEQRVGEIDTLGDGYAQKYGLRICGIGAQKATEGLGS
jgi:hypothetical protein